MDNQGITYAQGGVPTITRRAYNALTFGLVTVSFLVMWGCYLFAGSPAFAKILSNLSSGGGIAALIGMLVGTIGGIVLMSVGRSKQSVPISLGGFALFTLTFGFTTALALTHYNVGTVMYAFGITACLAGIFLILGVMFPMFFAKIGPVLMVGLIAVIAIEFIATIFFHAHQTILDYVVVALFCGFLGYDAVQMGADEPTVPNAIFYASDIFIDIVNILIRVLAILDRD